VLGVLQYVLLPVAVLKTRINLAGTLAPLRFCVIRSTYTHAHTLNDDEHAGSPGLRGGSTGALALHFSRLEPYLPVITYQ
jgi:hypothetical protein